MNRPAYFRVDLPSSLFSVSLLGIFSLKTNRVETLQILPNSSAQNNKRYFSKRLQNRIKIQKHYEEFKNVLCILDIG